MADPSFVLGVDLDGVCADHTAAFRRVVAAELNVDPATLGPQFSWDYTEWGLDEAEFLRLHRLAVLEHRMFADMPAVPGAAEALWRLSDAGVWIRLITHRLHVNWGHAVAVADTVSWLDRQGIPYRDLCFLGHKPHVAADAYVDDAPHNIDQLRAAGATAIIYDQPYNGHLPGLRARNWGEVETLVLDLVAAGGVAVQAQLDLPGVEDPPGRLRRPSGPAPDQTR